MLKGRAALVTGSTSGIGLGIAQALAAQGCDVALNGFGDAREIEALCADLQTRHAVRAFHGGADMTRPAEIRDLVADTQRRFGRLDILVNNAGIQHVAPVDAFPDDKWDAILAINLSSAFHTIKAALPGMRERGWGRILNIASAHGLVASVHKAAYIAAKHGLVGLTKTVALETAGQGITCNAICPGFVLTPLVQKQIDDRAAAEGLTPQAARDRLLLAKQPSGDFVRIEEVAAAAVYLASDGAASVTGISLSVDGGWTAQ